jgi:tRNA nucleotidyltransferase/poly(A) polymerase
MLITKYEKFLESNKQKDFISENRISMEMPVPNDVRNISDAYHKAGKDIFVVGGAVRDFLQGKIPHDYDLVTNALPEESKNILRDFNVSDEQGKNFGVLRIYTKDEPLGYEVASYRKDISKGRDTKGTDKKVELGSHITIEDDIRRRDLTINAIFYDIIKKEIVDLVGGVEDIKNGIIRAVGNPKERFIEDRLRICRVFRFAARTGGKIDKSTSDAIHSDNRLRGVGPKDDVSQERIWEEFEKAFEQVKNFNDYLDYITEFDMWDQIFPGANIDKHFVESSNLIVVIASLFKNENPNGLRDRLVSYKVPDSVESGHISTKVEFLVRLLSLTPENVFDMYKKKYQCGIDDNTILEWYKVNSINSVSSKYKSWIFEAFIDYKPSVSSEELMSQGFKGKALGDEIKRLEIEKFKQMI